MIFYDLEIIIVSHLRYEGCLYWDSKLHIVIFSRYKDTQIKILKILVVTKSTFEGPQIDNEILILDPKILIVIW